MTAWLEDVVASSCVASVAAVSAALAVLEAEAESVASSDADEAEESVDADDTVEPDESTTSWEGSPALAWSVAIFLSSLPCSSASLSSRSEVSSPDACACAIFYTT